MGFKDLHHSVKNNIYHKVLHMLKKKLAKKRNRKFGWTDSCGITGDDCAPWIDDIDFYIIVFDGKIVQIRLTTARLL